MNIVVKTASGSIIVRPDTTWERDNEDLFLPEFVERLSFTPVLFARVSKPGRSVGERFGERYYDGIGYGVLLYPEDMLDGSEEGYARACCLDHTSFLPFPVLEKSALGEGVFQLCVDGNSAFEYSQGSADMICKAIAEATRYVYIRTGDIIAIELDARRPLCNRNEIGSVQLTADYCNKRIIDFRVNL